VVAVSFAIVPGEWTEWVLRQGGWTIGRRGGSGKMEFVD